MNLLYLWNLSLPEKTHQRQNKFGVNPRKIFNLQVEEKEKPEKNRPTSTKKLFRVFKTGKPSPQSSDAQPPQKHQGPKRIKKKGENSFCKNRLKVY